MLCLRRQSGFACPLPPWLVAVLEKNDCLLGNVYRGSEKLCHISIPTRVRKISHCLNYISRKLICINACEDKLIRRG